MRRWFLVAAFITLPARADQLYVRVSVACTPSRINVSMESAWNGEGERLVKARPSRDTWGTSELVQFALDENGRYQIAARPKTVTCALGKRLYAVEVEPALAPRFHPEGWCATRVGATVTLRAGDKVLFTGGTDACTETGDVPTRVELRRDGTLIAKRVPAQVFLEPR